MANVTIELNPWNISKILLTHNLTYTDPSTKEKIDINSPSVFNNLYKRNGTLLMEVDLNEAIQNNYPIIDLSSSEYKITFGDSYLKGPSSLSPATLVLKYLDPEIDPIYFLSQDGNGRPIHDIILDYMLQYNCSMDDACKLFASRANWNYHKDMFYRYNWKDGNSVQSTYGDKLWELMLLDLSNIASVDHSAKILTSDVTLTIRTSMLDYDEAIQNALENRDASGLPPYYLLISKKVPGRYGDLYKYTPAVIDTYGTSPEELLLAAERDHNSTFGLFDDPRKIIAQKDLEYSDPINNPLNLLFFAGAGLARYPGALADIAVGADKAFKAITPSTYIPGSGYVGLAGGLTSLGGLIADGVWYGLPYVAAANNFSNNPTLDNGILLGLTALPFVFPAGANIYNRVKNGINFYRTNGVPLFNGARWYKNIPINENWLYRQGNGLAADAAKTGVIRAGKDPHTGRQTFTYPYFSKGKLHYGDSDVFTETIVNKGQGDYDWAVLNGVNEIEPTGVSMVHDMKGNLIPVDFGFRTPLVNGEANMASASDFTVFKPFRVFGRNFGFTERPIITSGTSSSSSSTNFGDFNLPAISLESPSVGSEGYDPTLRPSLLERLRMNFNHKLSAITLPVYYNQNLGMNVYRPKGFTDRLLILTRPKYREMRRDMNREFTLMIMDTPNRVGKQYSETGLFPGYMETVYVPDNILYPTFAQIYPRYKGLGQEDISRLNNVLVGLDKVNIISPELSNIMSNKSRGFVRKGIDVISINGMDNLNSGTYGHELEHILQQNGFGDYGQEYLDAAYGKLFNTMNWPLSTFKEKLFNNYKNRISPLYPVHMELKSVNYNLRNSILPENMKVKPVFEQNLYIDNVSESELLNRLERVNIYGYQFVSRLRNKYGNNIPKERMQAIRDALKYAPSISLFLLLDLE